MSKERHAGEGATLFVVATPIGNLEDVTYRAVRVLSEVGALACEDTRITRRLLERYAIARPEHMFACHEHNESRAAQRIAGLLAQGVDVALVSDAGQPGVSDPGYRSIQAALDGGHRVEVLPGPSAVTTALIASGLSAASYTFLGFPPRKSGQRRNFLAREAEAPHSLVLFESPHRIGKLLADALAALGDRRAAVCLELTKRFERVHRGWLADLARDFDGKQEKGEITVVIAGNNPKFLRADGSAEMEEP
ncbi:MAG: 16S rRNA (cytidine(1402)-2'-O)-methyltransferase [Rhodovibrionaceae bacterium]|nr:16S rRNA (cytidine(1402)-2'-O)-methyltransferase [Rhodovibrionaceae bacterium]